MNVLIKINCLSRMATSVGVAASVVSPSSPISARSMPMAVFYPARPVSSRAGLTGESVCVSSVASCFAASPFATLCVAVVVLD